MKTKLTLFVTVLAVALFGMGCVSAASGADNPIFIHGYKDYGKKDGVQILLPWAKEEGLSPKEIKAIEDQAEAAIGKVGLKKNPASPEYITIYCTQSIIKGEKYRLTLIDFGRRFKYRS